MNSWQIYLTLFILICSCHEKIHGQEIKTGPGEFKVDFDYARFYGDTGRIFTEIYYGIHENSLSYIQDSGKWVAAVRMEWMVRRDTAVVARKNWVVPHTIASFDGLSSQQTLIGIQSVGLPPGDYTMTLASVDMNNVSRTDSLSVEVPVTQYPLDRECFSDIEFCTSIKQSAEKQSPFYKNTLEVIPNPGRLYGSGLPIMYYYTIAYNLKSKDSLSPVNMRTMVLDAVGKEIYPKEKSKPRPFDASVEIGTVNLTGLKSGSYKFRIDLLDTSKNVVASAEKKFFVFKFGTVQDTSMAAVVDDFTASRYAIYSEEEVRRQYEYSELLASDFERQQFNNLTDLKAKQKFLFEFWKRRDPAPLTPVNEMEESYMRRIEYANEQYTAGISKGWKSDRGRVLILYGNPDEIERIASTSESHPYEIWHFNNIQGGVIFVFVDRDGLENYMLVHSTHRNEMPEPDWYGRYAQKMR